MLPRMRAGRVLLYASIATAVGCSLGLGGLGNGSSPTQDAQPDGVTSADTGVGGDADGGVGTEAAMDGGAPESASDAPHADAPPPPPSDGGTDGSPLNPSLCDDAGFLLCDGFENGIDGSVWTTETTSEGHLATGSTYIYRGAGALHASIDALPNGLPYGPSAQLHHHDTNWPAVLYVREFVYLPQLFPDNFPTLVTVAQYTQNPVGVQLNLAPNFADAWALTVFGDGAIDNTWRAPFAPPTSQWTCVEMTIDSGMGDVRVFVAGIEIPALHQNLGSVAPLDKLSLGLYFFNPGGGQPAADVWVDEVAVNGSMIACSQ
jgi:hypothetical protein